MKCYYLIFAIGILLSGCTGILSTELKSTKAEDMQITGSIIESETSGTSVRIVMKTMSDVRIEFNEGETILFESEIAPEQFESQYLALHDTVFFEYSTASISTAMSDGRYNLVYTDADDVSTTAEIQSLSAPTITNIQDGDVVDVSSAVVLQWDPELVQGSLSVVARADCSSQKYDCYESEYIVDEESGEVSLDLSDFTDSGSITLTQQSYFAEFDGFGGAELSLQQQKSIEVDFTN